MDKYENCTTYKIKNMGNSGKIAICVGYEKAKKCKQCPFHIEYLKIIQERERNDRQTV